jgi:hypothetical protein
MLQNACGHLFSIIDVRSNAAHGLSVYDFEDHDRIRDGQRLCDAQTLGSLVWRFDFWPPLLYTIGAVDNSSCGHLHTIPARELG